MMKRVFHSIIWKLIVIFLAINLLSILLIYSFSHYYFVKVIKTDYSEQSVQSAANLNHHMEFYFRQIPQSTTSLVATEEIQTFLNNNNPHEAVITDIIDDMSHYLAFNYPEIIGLFLLSQDGRVVSSLGKFYSDPSYYANEPWFHSPLAETLQIVPTHQVKYAQRRQKAISLVLPVSNVHSLGVVGNLVIDIDLSELEATFHNPVTDSKLFYYVVSGDGTIVYAQDSQLLGLPVTQSPFASIYQKSESGKASIERWQGQNWLISNSASGSLGWQVISMIPYKQAAGGLTSAQNATLIILSGLALILVLIVPLFSRKVALPIIQLKQLMSKVAGGDLSVRARLTSSRDEMQELNISFNQMVRQLTDLFETVYKLEIREMQLTLKQKEAVIRSLQNQINPHLLYNSLDIIKSMAYIEKNRNIEKIALNLGDLYRYNARITDVQVMFKDELEHVVKYLEIVKIRFPVHFQYKVYVNEKFFQCSCLKLMLQPIVENAVKHAIEPNGGEGTILISAYDERSDFVVEIADNGSGIPEEQLVRLQEQLSEIARHDLDGPNEQFSIGLTNVHARLVLHFGSSYGIRVNSFPGRGTIVSVRIPMAIKKPMNIDELPPQ